MELSSPYIRVHALIRTADVLQDCTNACSQAYVKKHVIFVRACTRVRVSAFVRACCARVCPYVKACLKQSCARACAACVRAHPRLAFAGGHANLFPSRGAHIRVLALACTRASVLHRVCLLKCV
eukprot:5672084-Pleurochrysis_carterae.AAC.3